MRNKDERRGKKGDSENEGMTVSGEKIKENGR